MDVVNEGGRNIISIRDHTPISPSPALISGLRKLHASTQRCQQIPWDSELQCSPRLVVPRRWSDSSTTPSGTHIPRSISKTAALVGQSCLGAWSVPMPSALGSCPVPDPAG